MICFKRLFFKVYVDIGMSAVIYVGRKSITRDVQIVLVVAIELKTMVLPGTIILKLKLRDYTYKKKKLLLFTVYFKFGTDV